MTEQFDVIVVGAGHAGCEAAFAASKIGQKTLLLTMSADQIGAMSCNPAIGGLGKSQLAREVDALGGLMCRVADLSAIQYRVLNESKGAAVRATRVQVDRHEYRSRMKWFLENAKNLQIKQGQVSRLLFNVDKISGVETSLGQIFHSRSVVITTGTFMNGKAHVGRKTFASGRAGEAPSLGLSDFLVEVGIKVGRFKTGTVPRIDRRTINFSKIEEQTSETSCQPLSFFSGPLRNDLESAFITYTNANTHKIIRENIESSPLFSGIIQSRGPRYCPSVEDKIIRFSDKERHQVFLEREGRMTNEVYVGGISTSLPYEVQIELLRSIVGLEDAEIVRPGYAIEYDYIDANQLDGTLRVKAFEGLYFAGQVNGTSGYEEAAAQGMVAGINAAIYAKDGQLDGFAPSRSDGYLGVLVSDLINKENSEPYRMFTSRAEWRLLLREDNADRRLSPIGHQLGLLSGSEFEFLQKKWNRRDQLKEFLASKILTPTEIVLQKLRDLNEPGIKTAVNFESLIKRPTVSLKTLMDNWSEDFSFCSDLSADDIWSVQTDIRYKGYIDQIQMQINQIQRLDKMKIPDDFDFQISGIPKESYEKLSKVKPKTLGQAVAISGVTPACISILAVHLMRRKKASSELACHEPQSFDVIINSYESSREREITR